MTKRSSDFTKREREIREALFAVFYEDNWQLTYRAPLSEKAVDEERWKFVDKVIDKLRRTQSKRPGRSKWATQPIQLSSGGHF